MDGGAQVPPPEAASATPHRVGFLSVHTSPLEQAGTGDGGGLNVYVVELARRMVTRGTAVDVFTRRTGPDLPATVRLADGVAVHHVDAGPRTATKDDLASHLCAFYLALAAHPATPGLDLLHGHYWMGGWVGRLARRRLGLPLVQTFHTLASAKNAALAPGEPPEPPLRLAAERHVAADADAIVAATAEEASLLREAYGASGARIHGIPPGVDLQTFSPGSGDDRAFARRTLGGGRILLFVGRLQPLKGPDLAIRTLAALHALLPDDGIPTRLVVVGGASGAGRGRSEPAALIALAEQLGVADRVAFLAPRPHVELAQLYRAADVVLMPSRSESFGLVALEAQACGTPVVASDVGGLRTVVGAVAGRRGGGTLVAGHAPEAHARAALPYLVDPVARVAAARAGRARAQQLSWDVTAERTLDVYRHVLAVRQPARVGQRGA